MTNVKCAEWKLLQEVKRAWKLTYICSVLISFDLVTKLLVLNFGCWIPAKYVTLDLNRLQLITQVKHAS